MGRGSQFSAFLSILIKGVSQCKHGFRFSALYVSFREEIRF